jgi:hypothetical protein
MVASVQVLQRPAAGPVRGRAASGGEYEGGGGRAQPDRDAPGISLPACGERRMFSRGRRAGGRDEGFAQGDSALVRGERGRRRGARRERDRPDHRPGGGAEHALFRGHRFGQGRACRPAGLRRRHPQPIYGPGHRPQCGRQFHGRGPNGRREGAPSGQGSYGEAPSGCSDTDSGSGADPGGRGRRCNGIQPWPRSNEPTHTRHCTDSDRGNNADPIQEGRHC